MPRNFFDIKNETELLESDYFAFFTRDPDLLSEYESIRDYCYREIEGLPTTFDKKEHIYDDVADHLILTYKDVVIGGARIVGKFPGDEHDIPLESEEVTVEAFFPELNLKNSSYCEFTRLAILRHFRTPYLLRYVLETLSKYAIAKGYRYLFSISHPAQARNSRQVFRALGLPHPYKIYKDLEVPDKKGKYGDLNVCLASMEFPNEWKGIKDRGDLLNA